MPASIDGAASQLLNHPSIDATLILREGGVSPTDTTGGCLGIIALQSVDEPPPEPPNAEALNNTAQGRALHAAPIPT